MSQEEVLMQELKEFQDIPSIAGFTEEQAKLPSEEDIQSWYRQGTANFASSDILDSVPHKT
jgi:hypothetical protein